MELTNKKKEMKIKITLTKEEYRDFAYALILAMEVCRAEKNPRLEKLQQLFDKI